MRDGMNKEIEARQNAMRWIDGRVDALRGDLGLVESDMMQKIVKHWIDDLKETGRKLSTSARTCNKYDGRWDSQKKSCKR